MSNFTPGPWEWVKNDFFGGYSGIVGKNGEEVLFPNHCNDGNDGAAWFEEFPKEADRCLIVAAPDMYEALNKILTLTTYIPLDKNVLEIISLAEDAIAKATN